MFVRGLVEAAAAPPEDRLPAITEVIDSWYEARQLLYAPPDDEPVTEEEEAEHQAALEELHSGKGVPLEQILARGKRRR
jgi:hypothetical protein